jgi:hypothetical protein
MSLWKSKSHREFHQTTVHALTHISSLFLSLTTTSTSSMFTFDRLLTWPRLMGIAIYEGSENFPNPMMEEDAALIG